MGEFVQINRNRLPFLVLFPLLKVDLEGRLEVKSHCSEASSLEVEVEIHVVLVRLQGVCGQFCLVFYFCFAKHFRPLLHLSEVILGSNSFLITHLTFGQFLTLNFLPFRLLLHNDLLGGLCDLVRISDHWHFNVSDWVVFAVGNRHNSRLAFFNLNWRLNLASVYRIRRHEELRLVRLELMLDDRWLSSQLVLWLVIRPVLNKFVMLSHNVIHLMLRFPGRHLTVREGRLKFLSHELISKLVLSFSKQMSVLSIIFWLKQVMALVEVASLDAWRVKCTSSEGVVFNEGLK